MSATIGVWNPKGGVGKTTIAINMADYLGRQKQKVLLVDVDRQNGALLHKRLSELTNENKPEGQQFKLHYDVISYDDYTDNEREELFSKYDFVILDYPPTFSDGRKLQFYSPFYLMPIVMDSSSIASAQIGKDFLTNKGNVVVPVVSLFEASNKTQMNFKETLFPNAPVIGRRSTYQTSNSQGCTVFTEDHPSGFSARFARDEMKKMIEVVLTTMAEQQEQSETE